VATRPFEAARPVTEADLAPRRLQPSDYRLDEPNPEPIVKTYQLVGVPAETAPGPYAIDHDDGSTTLYAPVAGGGKPIPL